MSKEIEINNEWNRVEKTLYQLKNKRIATSLDTRKSLIIEKVIKLGVKLINDI